MKPALIVLLTVVNLLCGCAGYKDYPLSRHRARQAVLSYALEDCEKAPSKPRLPYRQTFKQAMQGDFAALSTVLTDSNYRSGDNESWCNVPWQILHAVGDQRFSEYLLHLAPSARTQVFAQLLYIRDWYPHAEFDRYFARRFPRTKAVCEVREQPESSLSWQEASSSENPVLPRDS